jgi:hypothetical protein
MDFKLFLQDLKEKELYLPLVGIVVAFFVILLILQMTLMEANAKVNREIKQLNSEVKKYWPLKANEQENLALIEELITKLNRKFLITERIYVKNQSDFEIHLKGTSGIGARLEEATDVPKLFKYTARTEGRPQRMAKALKYRAQIEITGTLEDVYRLLKELQREDIILLEISEILIQYKQYSKKNKQAILHGKFIVSAYQRREKDKKRRARRRSRRLDNL